MRLQHIVHIVFLYGAIAAKEPRPFAVCMQDCTNEYMRDFQWPYKRATEKCYKDICIGSKGDPMLRKTPVPVAQQQKTHGNAT
ncbi:hypothetical protein PoMZ_10283 [Pyricularia oryzae]|uniref:Extracellular membrane protein CFEM domain-containing protein n=1 Tax=Pyricularia oryzae TaxID=318829 RepID=A0A4P7MX15_PYROR|nr:hypothetical protein PoMZ_10283 [Pyricularia oryzae]